MTHSHDLRRQQLLTEAAQSRLRRECRRGARRPGLALRVYARLWWASRPRVDTWPRSILEA